MTLTIRVMTWNVHGTFNLNPRFDIGAVSSIIRKWSPDIWGLQEIDSRGRSDNPFERLAGVVGAHNVDARSIVTADGDYGQVLLSKWPFIRAPTIVDVSYREREARRAISACIQSPVGEVAGGSPPISGLSIRERQEQARAIVNLIGAPRTIVLGDFNDSFWVESVRRILAQRCLCGPDCAPFHHGVPCFDLIAFTPCGRGVSPGHGPIRKPRFRPDHLPVSSPTSTFS